MPKSSSRRSATPDYAAVAGRSESTLVAATGCGWARWVRALDRVEAHAWTHRDIAKHVRERYDIPGWRAQTITVGYERIKGLRAVGQRRNGTFEANKSKTVGVPLARLYRAVHDARTRSRWLPGVKPTVRTATGAKSMRLTWPDQTSVVIGFTNVGPGKSQVAVQHGGLSSRAKDLRAKKYWGERLEALRAMLVPADG